MIGLEGPGNTGKTNGQFSTGPSDLQKQVLTAGTDVSPGSKSGSAKLGKGKPTWRHTALRISKLGTVY